MVHRPQDLDATSSLAFLQEEASQDLSKRSELGIYSKKQSSVSARTSIFSIPSPTRTADEKKTLDSPKTKLNDDKFSALKSYRRSKGLCFKCGEKWSPQHKCPDTVSLHAMEELWKCFSDSEDTPNHTADEASDSGDDLMAIFYASSDWN